MNECLNHKILYDSRECPRCGEEILDCINKWAKANLKQEELEELLQEVNHE